jgi:hypothetical protein
MCICKMQIESLLQRLQQFAQQLLHFAVTAPG